MYAHSLVLAAFSPILLEILKGEKLKDLCEIDFSNEPNCSVEVMQGFLDYVYGIKIVRELENIVVGLLKFGNSYQVKSLKFECENYLAESLNLSNAIDYLSLACEYECNVLKDVGINFVSTNIEKIKESDNFDEFLEKRNLTIDLMRSVSLSSPIILTQRYCQPFKDEIFK